MGQSTFEFLAANRDEVLSASDFRDLRGTAHPTHGACSAPGARMRPLGVLGHHEQNSARLHSRTWSVSLDGLPIY